jgi:hypothetical protein
MAERYGVDMGVPDWRGRLVRSKCESRDIDMVVTGTKRRRELWDPDAAPHQPLGWGSEAQECRARSL